MCSVDEAGYVAIEKAIQFGIDLHTSLPLSQRLTLLSSEELAKKDHDFKMWKQFDYLLNKDK